jgi:hypothetical protein
MAKLNEIVYDIRESLKELSDDSEIDNRHIIYLLSTKRAKYLRQDLNNFQKTTDTSIQQTFCLQLEEVSADQCGVDIYCDKVIRTKKPLPRAIELHTSPAITKVRPTNRLAIPFNFISREKAPFLKSAPFGKSIYAFLDTDYHIYFVSTSDTYKLIDCITVSGIFENPLDLTEYTNCCICPDNVEPCFDEMNSEYPLQPHYVDLIKNEIINDLLRLKGVPEDKENDSNTPAYGAK